MSGEVRMEKVEETFQLPNYPIECYRTCDRGNMDTALLHWHFCCEMVVIHRGEEHLEVGGDHFVLRPGMRYTSIPGRPTSSETPVRRGRI